MKLHQRECAHWRGVPRRVADHDSARPMADRGRVQLLHHLGIAARGVFGDIHDVEAERHGVLHRASR